MTLTKAVCISALLLGGCRNAAPDKPTPPPKDVVYTIENCISEFSPDDVKKTKKGWSFWHVPKGLSPKFNFKISNVEAKSANHAPHSHPEEEIFYIFEGKAEFFLNGKTRVVGPRSTLFCPSGSMHGIRNVGDTPLTYAVIKANYPQ